MVEDSQGPQHELPPDAKQAMIATFLLVLARVIAKRSERRPRHTLFLTGLAWGIQLALENQAVASRYLLALRDTFDVPKTSFAQQMAKALVTMEEGGKEGGKNQ